MRYFLAVAEELNFTRAAQRLSMAQPPLSAAIRQLEDQLGVRLLERTPREVRLTAAGEVLVDRGRALVAEAEATFAAVRAVERTATGLLKVGVSPAARRGLLPQLVDLWAAEAPGVMVHTREDTTGAMLRDVAHGRLDLAVVFCPFASPGVVIEPLCDEPAVLHVNDGNPLARRDTVTMADLAHETILVAGGTDSPGYTAAVIAHCRAAGFEPRTTPDPYPDLGVHAVREGLGVLVYVASASNRESLVGSRLVPIADVFLPFGLAWREGDRSGAVEALRAVVDRWRRDRGTSPGIA